MAESVKQQSILDFEDIGFRLELHYNAIQSEIYKIQGYIIIHN